MRTCFFGDLCVRALYEITYMTIKMCVNKKLSQETQKKKQNYIISWTLWRRRQRTALFILDSRPEPYETDAEASRIGILNIYYIHI